ncbi:sensor histidine kinase [Sphingobium sp. AP50]|uniref:sensor histidine kinase n=1 Tax=Sphingobium sp. AP50 TaxID=1884369 RepID=UPI0015A525B1|nr:sensor histidine kinase [Sphingobium sp. AP50]
MAVWRLATLLFVTLFIGVTGGLAADSSTPDTLPGWAKSSLAKRDGAPSSIRTITQDGPGAIWIASAGGLYRYDGVNFERIPTPRASPSLAEAVVTLLATPDGDLWVGHDYGGLSLRRHDGTTRVQSLPGTAFFMARGPDGTGWYMAASGHIVTIYRLDGERWIAVAKDKLLGLGGTSFVVARNGSLVYVLDGKLKVLRAGRKSVETVMATSIDAHVAVSPRGELWLWSKGVLTQWTAQSDGGIVRIAGSEFKMAVSSLALLAFDRSGALWLGDGSGKIDRFERTHSKEFPWRLVGASPFERGEVSYGFSAFVDRENGLWLAGKAGLERLAKTAFDVPTELVGREGINFDHSAVRDGLGTVWLREHETIFSITPEGALLKRSFVLPYKASFCPASTGGLWVPAPGKRLTIAGGSSRPALSLVDTTAFGTSNVLHCVEDSRGRLWVSDYSRLKLLGPAGARTVDFGKYTEHTANLTLAADHQGGVYVYIGRVGLFRSNGDQSTLLLSQGQLPVGFAEVVFQGTRHLYLGGDRGLLRYDGRRFTFLSRDRFPWLTFVSGIAETRDDTWVQGINGVARLRTADLDRAFGDRNFKPPVHLYDSADGIPGNAVFWNVNSLASDAEGRVWVMTSGGLARFDPARGTNATAPPTAVITQIRARSVFGPAPTAIRLPSGTTRVEIRFTAYRYADPQRMRFRYTLSNVDNVWVDGGTSRSATYTALSPGTYHFRVIAADRNGAWSTVAAETTFTIAPTFLQGWLFKALCIVAALLLITVLYKLRLHYMANRIRQRMETQLHERERIAQDLHDTLLQSVQALIIRVHGLSLRPSIDMPTRDAIASVLDETERALAVGREHVAGLKRARTVALHRQIEEIASGSPVAEDVQICVDTEGEERLLTQLVAEEASLVAGEAFRNAARHAQASNIRATVKYSPDWLEITVADDGVGIDEEVLVHGGREGHFGLSGMRERAIRIGGRLNIDSGPSTGTTVQLIVPARLAYKVDHTRRSGFWRWRR